MPKQIVVTGLGNKIEYATTNDKGLITGKREDVTDQCIDAVYQQFKTAFKRDDKATKQYGFKYADGGQLLYIPPSKDE